MLINEEISMTSIQEGDLIWQPSQDVIANANLTHYMRWLAEHETLHVDTYDELWQWSVENIEDFWRSLVQYCDIQLMKEPNQTMMVSQNKYLQTRRTSS